jgi:deoxyribonuclease-2
MTISALNEDGNPVDWWFAYKLPTLPNLKFDNDPRNWVGEAQGTEYLYCDATSPTLPKALASHGKIPANILETGALVNTIRQLHDAAQNDPQVGWFSYNDEHPKYHYEPIPGMPPDNWDFGHSKGVLAFDLGTNTAFWLLHSWPCYPFISLTQQVDPPSRLFGQTFLCISLKDVATADLIAKVFHHQSQPQIIDMNLPGMIDVKQYPNLVQLAKDRPPAPVPLGNSEPSDTAFYSSNGTEFRLFAKSKDWLVPAKDLYSDYIGPTLGVDLEVETWQDGELPQDSDGTHTTQDIQWIDLRPLGLNYAWHFLVHDHAKWAVSKDPDTQDETDWVIVADINRIVSQYKRGGVGIAFQNQALAHSLHTIISLVPPSQDIKGIEDALDILLPGQSAAGIPMPPADAGTDPTSPMAAQ